MISAPFPQDKIISTINSAKQVVQLIDSIPESKLSKTSGEMQEAIKFVKYQFLSIKYFLS